MKFLSIFFALITACMSLAHAVVVISASPNTSAPAGQPFFGNVGIVNGSSGIYLGDRWVLTAAHVATSLPAAADFGGTSYNTVAGSYQRLSNPGVLLTAETDLAMFRLAADPGLPTVSIAATIPLIGADVMMIGRGRDQQSTRTFWDVTVGPGTNDDVWNEVSEGAHNRSGFKTDTSRTIRWGENDVATVGQVSTYNFGNPSQTVDVISFTTSFDDNAKTHEAQGIAGDSGGAVFTTDGSDWTLAGVMLAVMTEENQPSQTAVIGNSTIIADLSAYRTEILAVIPEPSAAVLGLFGGCVLLARRRRC